MVIVIQNVEDQLRLIAALIAESFQVYVRRTGTVENGLPVWIRTGNHGDKWHKAQVPVKNKDHKYQVCIFLPASNNLVAKKN